MAMRKKQALKVVLTAASNWRDQCKFMMESEEVSGDDFFLERLRIDIEEIEEAMGVLSAKFYR